MNKLLHIVKRDLADPMGSAITAALLAALITLAVIMGMMIERSTLNHPDSVRAVQAEDECAYGVRQVKRYNGQLYCIGEPW
jgi:hypothetical protein